MSGQVRAPGAPGGLGGPKDARRRYAWSPGNTWSTITASVENLKELDFDKFFTWIYSELIDLKEDREAFYGNLRASKWRLMSRLRGLLVLLGIVAVLATVLAAAAPLIAGTGGGEGLGRPALLIALAAYAIMGAIGLYERGTDLSASYFRLVAATISIRNQWNRMQITLLKEFPALLADADQSKSRARVCALADEFCAEIDKIVTTERDAWQAAYVKSLEELDKAATAGLKQTQDKLTALAADVQKAIEAAKPAHVNLELAGVEGEVTVLVDGVDAAKQTSTKFVLAMQPGLRILTIKGTKNGKELIFSESKQIAAGVNAWKLAPA